MYLLGLAKCDPRTVAVNTPLTLGDLCGLSWRIGNTDDIKFRSPACAVPDYNKFADKGVPFYSSLYDAPLLRNTFHLQRTIETGINRKVVRVQFADNPSHVYFSIQQPFTLAEFIHQLTEHWKRTDCNIEENTHSNLCLQGSPDNGIFDSVSVLGNRLIVHTAS